MKKRGGEEEKGKGRVGRNEFRRVIQMSKKSEQGLRNECT